MIRRLKFYKHLKQLKSNNTLLQYFNWRSQLKFGLHKYLEAENYVHVDRPVLTRFIPDIEKNVFYLKENLEAFQGDDALQREKPLYLNPSGQLYLELLTNSLKKVYSIMPCFDARGKTLRGLSEYWTLDCEEAFLHGEEGFYSLMSFTENIIKHVIFEIIQRNLPENLIQMLNKPCIHLTYEEASAILSRSVKFSGAFKYGQSLNRASEEFLCKSFNDSLIFITKHPYFLRPFNAAKIDDTSNEVFSFVLLVPQIGECASGGLREHNVESLISRLTEYHGQNYYSWFTNLKSWGCPPSGGVSIGLDRLLMFIGSEKDIHKVVPFPRAINFCPC